MIRFAERLSLLLLILLIAPSVLRAQADPESALRDGPPATNPSTRPTTEPVAAIPIADRLPMTTWAEKGTVKNPVALTFDRSGACYVAQTQRREGGELQTRTDPLHRV
ncbi:MAG TPA: hypothetical protein VLJ39_08425, partial [Tepidisphaeraceae bacterium]|nr:hypothetical protein [Tepidisphaeraceae bacterium]